MRHRVRLTTDDPDYVAGDSAADLMARKTRRGKARMMNDKDQLRTPPPDGPIDAADEAWWNALLASAPNLL